MVPAEYVVGGLTLGEILAASGIFSFLWWLVAKVIVGPSVAKNEREHWQRDQEEWRREMDEWRMEVVSRLDELRLQTRYTSGQLRENGGRTALDAVVRIEKMLKRLMPEDTLPDTEKGDEE